MGAAFAPPRAPLPVEAAGNRRRGSGRRCLSSEAMAGRRHVRRRLRSLLALGMKLHPTESIQGDGQRSAGARRALGAGGGEVGADFLSRWLVFIVRDGVA